MALARNRSDSGFGVGIFSSTVIHLTVFLLLYYYGSFAPHLVKEETYYVDIVNLPVADPRQGNPAVSGNEQPSAAPKQDSETQMTAPSPQKQPLQPTKPQKQQNKKAEVKKSADDFSDRLSKLQQSQEARDEENAIARLKEKVKNDSGKGRSGMPKGTGTEAGSNYSDYIQSRLKDAFAKTISYTSKKPEVAVRLFIDSNGKLARKKTEKSSNDAAFEISVLRAIDIASEKFPPPPNRKMFDAVFVFRPDGITPNK